jgi:hypothetical protein
MNPRIALSALLILIATVASAGSPEQDPHPVRLTTNGNEVVGCPFVVELTASFVTKADSAGALRYAENRAAYRMRRLSLMNHCDFVLITATTAIAANGEVAVVYRGEAYDCGGIR